ncbi:MAG: class I SAM-dependent methyltransferase [Chloroflexi bacterium]|nr:class I SAM-dependent methyltransferase [Chloroflexota bacterium]
MPHPEAQRWDARYRCESDFWLELEPRQLLTSYAHFLSAEGRALDAACGVGINACFLAQHGLRTFALDISEYALRLAKQRARNLNLALEAVVTDLSNPWLPAKYFDVILNFHFLERATIPVYRQALKPGGLIFFDTFRKRHDRNDNLVYYLDPGELKGWFHDFEIIHYTENEVLPSEDHSERGLAQLIARKP